MKSAVRVKGVVSSKGRLRLLEPVELPAGECEVIVLPVTVPPDAEPVTRPIRKALEGLVGLWADRNDIEDPVEYAARLRSDLETGRDRRE
jgi:hypothetical protein